MDLTLGAITLRSSSAVWEMLLLEGRDNPQRIKLDGGVAIGPRLQSFLEQLKEKITRYPVTITFHHIQDNRTLQTKYAGKKVSYLEASVALVKIIPQAYFMYDEKVVETVEKKPVGTSETLDLDRKGYIAICKLTKVVDGDTVHVTFAMPDEVTNWGSQWVKNGLDKKEVQIRYLGCDTPESVDNKDYDDTKNAKFARYYQVSTDDMSHVAKEASLYNKMLLGASTDGKPGTSLCIIHLDCKTNGELITDKYGRHLGEVYATSDPSAKSIYDKMVSGGSFINCNKTLLTTKSTGKKTSHVPLAMLSYYFVMKDNGTIGAIGWPSELGLDQLNVENTIDPSLTPHYDSATDITAPKGESYKVKTTTIYDNTTEWVTPVDDRIDEFLAGFSDDINDIRSHSRTRIGDVILNIPPTSIQASTTSNIQQVKTLRTKSSAKYNNGHSFTVLKMNLYFHNLENINGRKIPWKKGSDKVFYVDGLRSLLAQFSKCPFLPIDNYYINSVLGIEAVALQNIKISTVPDFPESLQAELTLIEFNHEPVIFDDFLGETINYPLMRWYYQQAMTDRGPTYRYFKGIEGGYSSSFSFQIADEAYLQARKDATAALNKLENPENYADSIQKNPTVKGKKEDSDAVQQMMDAYSMYISSIKPSIKNYSIIDSDPSKKVLDSILEIYGLSVYTNQVKTDAIEFYNLLYGFTPKTQLLSQAFTYVPYEAYPFYENRFGISSNDLDVSLYPYADLIKGIFVVSKFKVADNQKIITANFNKYYNKKHNRYYIPATDANIKILRGIQKGYEAVMANYSAQKKHYDDLIEFLNTGEYNVPLVDVKLEGSLILTQLNAILENQFAMINVAKTSAATLQYMGGGEASVEAIFEADEKGVKSFVDMLKRVDDLSVRYKEGITNGFLGMKNDLANLLGMRHIMFNNYQVSTVPGFPDRFTIQATIVEFDTTQRKQEELKGVPGMTKDMSLADLEGMKGKLLNDRVLEARLHELEVYPDLELPTYDELNDALPYLDCKIKTYPNPTGAVYVDPDFYFSHEETVRRIVESNFNNQNLSQMNLFDDTGVGVFTNHAMDKAFDTTDGPNGVWPILKKQEQKSTPTDSVDFSWTANGNETSPALDAIPSSPNASMPTYGPKNADTYAFMTQKTSDGKYVSDTFPTEAEWYKLFGADTSYDYDDFVEHKNPSEYAVYQELKSLITKYFGDVVMNPGFVKNIKGASDEAQVNAYAPPSAFYAATFDLLSKRKIDNVQAKGLTSYTRLTQIPLTNSLISDLKDMFIEPSEIKEGESVKDSAIIKPKIEKGEDGIYSRQVQGLYHERIMTLCKAFLDATSNWTHWSEEGPHMSNDRERVGIAAVNIRPMLPTEAKKVLWNWKYNLKVAVKQLREYFDQAVEPITTKKDLKRFEVYCCPQDAMFAAYELNRLPHHVRDMDTPIFNATMKQFNKYARKPYVTFSGMNKKVYASYLSGNSGTKEIINAKTKKDKAKMIDILLDDLHYREKSYVKSKGFEWKGTSDKFRKQLTKEYLQGVNVESIQGILYVRAEELKSIYQKAKEKDKVRDKPGAHQVTPIVDKDGTTITKKMYELAKEILNTRKDYVDQVNANRLMNNDTPQATYEKMFYDLRKYDMRGRMARAFPSFQMFIIQEGSWMAEYRFFDNMYGFNAIESIDVYRSRKIAADTAVVRMSNVYGNLTTKHIDIDTMQGDLKFWDNLVFNRPPKELVEAKKRIPKTLYVQPGARISLRMGYGSNVRELPVVFNGTITEMNADTVIEFVCQGDGIELGNTISGDPDDTNKGFLHITEPRDVICQLMGSKGSWLKNMLYNASNGLIMKENPLGIAHFGLPYDENEPGNNLPIGYTSFFNTDYGEVAQNIYSTNGTPTYGQWLWPNGRKRDIFNDFNWENFKKFRLQPGDEDNLVLKYYNNTVWDVIQTITLCTPDYIATPFPYELRSSLFFGKPYWNCSFGYDSEYIWDRTQKTWIRYIREETRRPYMQYKMYATSMDVINNSIRVQDETLFTNVITNYDGKATPVIYADSDIRYDRQKTRVVEADIMSRGKLVNFWTAERQATNYGASALRQNMMDMYQGYLTVIGDPTVKPYDLAHLTDEINVMNGMFSVKAVTHHLSFDTGFITQIEPDCITVNDDVMLENLTSWGTSTLSAMAGRAIVIIGAKKSVKWLGGLWNSKWMPKIGKNLGFDATSYMLEKMTSLMDGEDETIKKVKDELKAIRAEKDFVKKKEMFKTVEKLFGDLHEFQKNKAVEKGAMNFAKRAGKSILGNAGKLASTAAKNGLFEGATKALSIGGRGLFGLTPIGLLTQAIVMVATETLLEKYRRFKQNQQSVMCMPLMYRGTPLFAGLYGHAGLVKGDPPGKMDLIWAGKSDNKYTNFGIDIANFLANDEEDPNTKLSNEMTALGKSY